MDYLRTVGYNSLAYFVLDRLGLAEVVAKSTGLEQAAGNSATFALAYTGINEGMDFLDDGKSKLTNGDYFGLADSYIWNYLFIFGIQRTQLDYVISDMMNAFSIPSGDIRVSVVNGVLLSLGNILRLALDQSGVKQLRIATRPSSFLYASTTGQGNAYL